MLLLVKETSVNREDGYDTSTLMFHSEILAQALRAFKIASPIGFADAGF